MTEEERTTNLIFEMISECFRIPLEDISRDYQIGVRIENVRMLELEETFKILGLLESVEFTMRLEEELDPNIVRTPMQRRKYRHFFQRLATGQVTAGQLIDWMMEYEGGTVA